MLLGTAMRRRGSNLAARLSLLHLGAQRPDERLLKGDALGDDPRDRLRPEFHLRDKLYRRLPGAAA